MIPNAYRKKKGILRRDIFSLTAEKQIAKVSCDRGRGVEQI